MLLIVGAGALLVATLPVIAGVIDGRTLLAIAAFVLVGLAGRSCARRSRAGERLGAGAVDRKSENAGMSSALPAEYRVRVTKLRPKMRGPLSKSRHGVSLASITMGDTAA